MSLLSAVLLPLLEKQLAEVSPALAAIAVSQLKVLGQEVINWAERKTGVDIDGDGTIGGEVEKKD